MDKESPLSTELLRKWLEGSANQEEREIVATWASDSEAKEKELISGKMVYMATLVHEYDSEGQKKQRRRSRILLWSVSIAAMFVAVLSVFLVLPSNRENMRLSAINITVPVGQMSQLMLSDSTHVWLNSNSKLNVIEGKKGERTVDLKGEGYFEVAKDPNHPFIVRCGNRTVKVLGTSFRLSSYSQDRFSLKLYSGSVEMTDKLTNYACRLVPDEQIEYVNGHYLRTHGDAADKIDWIDGTYSFTDVSLETIMRKVGEYYGVSIQFQDSLIKQMRCTCSFHSGNGLENILDLICKAYDNRIRYNINEDKTTVTIHY